MNKVIMLMGLVLVLQLPLQSVQAGVESGARLDIASFDRDDDDKGSAVQNDPEKKKKKKKKKKKITKKKKPSPS